MISALIVIGGLAALFAVLLAWYWRRRGETTAMTLVLLLVVALLLGLAFGGRRTIGTEPRESLPTAASNASSERDPTLERDPTFEFHTPITPLHGADPNERRTATLRYNRPGEMRLYRTEAIEAELAIGSAEASQSLGDAGEIIERDVSVTRYVGVELTSPGRDFRIEPSGVRRSTLNVERTSQWQWEVTPTSLGAGNVLVLTVYSIDPNAPEFAAPLKPTVREVIPVRIAVNDLPGVAVYVVRENAVLIALGLTALGGVMVFFFNAFKDSRPRAAWGVIVAGSALVLVPTTVAAAGLFLAQPVVQARQVVRTADIEFSDRDRRRASVPRASAAKWAGAFTCGEEEHRMVIALRVMDGTRADAMVYEDEGVQRLSGTYDPELGVLTLGGTGPSDFAMALRESVDRTGVSGQWLDRPGCGPIQMSPVR